MKNLILKIGWLYPDLMSTYGDRGNIIVLQKRCLWRGIQVEIKRISLQSKIEDLKSIDLIFMGGAQDIQQEIVNKDLFSGKGEVIIKAVNKNIPALFICGAYQFMGKYYKTADGKKLPGLRLFNLYTENPGLKYKRLIGNILIKSSCHAELVSASINQVTKWFDYTHHLEPVERQVGDVKKQFFAGFENHGGRTYLADKSQAFATVVKGYGNNGEDRTEGMIYKNAIGTYLHGPILPKNPEIADWLIQKTLEVKYKEKVDLKLIDDQLEHRVRESVIKSKL